MISQQPGHIEPGQNPLSWFQLAQLNYYGARTLFDESKPELWFSATILGHHAIECYLKATFLRRGFRVETKGEKSVWGHDLQSLTKRLLGVYPLAQAEVLNAVALFDAYFEELRYPTQLNSVKGLGMEEAAKLDAICEILRPLAQGE